LHNVLAFDGQQGSKTAQDVFGHVTQQKEKLLVCGGDAVHGLWHKNK
jgi:hypothetical protein